MHKRGGATSYFFVVIIQLKTVDGGWELNLYLQLQKLAVLHADSREALEILNVSKIVIKTMTRQRPELGFIAPEPWCPTPYAMATIGMEFLTNIWEIIKNFGTTENRTRICSFRTLLAQPHYCHIIFNKKIFRNFGLKREKKRPYRLKNFSCIIHIWQDERSYYLAI